MSSIVCPPFDSRQGAVAFNLPLSFDTSSVTTMGHMFRVRSSLVPCPPRSGVEPSPARCLHRRRPPPPAPAGLHTSLHTACPPFDSRQNAKAFNQPLSFDTSSVTDMRQMFYVRSSPCAAPNLQPSPFPCALRASRSPAALPPSRATPRPASYASLRLGRPQTPCPTPTSCSSVARGWAPRPSTLVLALA